MRVFDCRRIDTSSLAAYELMRTENGPILGFVLLREVSEHVKPGATGISLRTADTWMPIIGLFFA